jgi:curved DNA-binding protein CbpA
VLKELRRSAETKKIPVVVMSGVFPRNSAEREFLEAGAQVFLEKPFPGRALLGAVLDLIGPPGDAHSEVEAAPERSDLGVIPAIEVLWRAMNAGYSGGLHFQRGKLQKILVLREGQPILVRSNSVKECLGRRLLAAGVVDQAALDESLRRSRDDGRKQGEVFLELGLVTEDQMRAALTEQAAEKLLSLFSWAEGECWLQDSVTNLGRASSLEGWTGRATVVYGARRVPQQVVARRLQPYLEAQVSRSEVELTEHESMAPGVDEALAACVPGAVVGEHMERHGAALYGLWLAGVLSFGNKAGQQDAAEQVEAALVEDDKLVELKRKLKEFEALTYFQILHVERDASPGKVRESFLKLAKIYHPDRYSGEAPEVRAVAADIFALMSSAHDTLSDAAQRREYVGQLDRGATTGQDQAEVLRILRAESAFRDAEAMVKRRDYPGAVAKLKEAINQNAKEGDFHSLLGWARFCANHDDSDNVAKAFEELQKGISLAPGSVTGYYYLAKLNKACDDEDEARALFRKVLEIDPKHLDASREMRLLKMRDQKSGGLFGFGRKKT